MDRFVMDRNLLTEAELHGILLALSKDEPSPHIRIQDASWKKLAAWLLSLLYLIHVCWNRNCLGGASSEREGIKWTTCGENIECGRLELLQPFRWKCITFLGGPGASGVGFVQRAGKHFSDMLDGRYDIVSWDPRGVNGSTPRIDCFTSQAQQDVFFANTHEEMIIPDSRNLSDGYDRAAFAAGLRLADARNAVFARLCHEQAGDVLKYVSTTAVVRDLVRLYDELEGRDSSINFWGFSYGTLLGNYFVNMFPDRVGKVVLDGVMNPDLWANSHHYTWEKDFFANTETTLYNFYAGCAEAGPARCALASSESTAESISGKIDDLLDQLYARPMAVWNSTRPGPLTASMLLMKILISLYSPRTWPTFASDLASALAGDGTPIVSAFLAPLELDATAAPRTQGNAPKYAITCTDTPPYPYGDTDAGTTKALDEIIREMALAQRQTSRHFGALDIDVCHHWRARAAERFTGPFNHTLKNKILLIGNTADPIAPLHNARAVNEMLSHSSRLIVQNGSGHCSSAMASLCTGRVVQAYFLEGKLPNNNLWCETDEGLFPPEPGSKLFDKEETSRTAYSAEDNRLLSSLRFLGREVSAMVAA